MLGALIGDIVGSVYEFNNIKTKDFPLFSKESMYTDDSVMTLAIAEICQKGYINDKDKIIDTLKKWGKAYPNAGYGGHFYGWVLGDDRKQYNSCGNGSAMRVSACGWYGKTEWEVKEYATKVTEVTHNHPEGIKGAVVTALCIYYARIGKSKEFIKEYAEREYPEIKKLVYEELRRTCEHGPEICQVTVPQALYCFLISNSFEDCIRTTISIGGDCDTTAAISGAIAEAYYKDQINDEILDDILFRIPTPKNDCNANEVLKNFLEYKNKIERRKEELFNMLTEYCRYSSIKYKDDNRYLSSIKLIIQTGEIVFVSRDRHLDIVTSKIPNWNRYEDMCIIDELNDMIHFKMCEGDKYNGSYTYSIMLLKDDIVD